MKRKSLLVMAGVLSLVAVLLLPALLVGCAKQTTQPSTTSSQAAKSSSTSALSTSASPTAKPSPSPTTTLSRQQQLEAGARKEGSIIFWASFATDVDKWLTKFKERYPWLKVETWQADNTTVAEKVIAENKGGAHNVDVLGMADEVWLLFPQSLLAKHDWPNASYYPADAVQWNGLYIRTHFNLNGPAYNTKILTGANVPKSWDDLKDPKWKGKSAASLSAEEAPLGLAAIWGTGGKLDWDRSFSFWREVFKNTEPRIVNLYTGPTKLLGAGEFEVFNYTATNVAMKEKELSGLPVAPVPLSPLPAKPSGIGILKDAPHPNAARLFADWLTSPEGAAIFTSIMFSPSLNTGAGDTAANRILKEKGIGSFMMTPVMTAENLNKSREFWKELTGAKK
ncbi:MAG: extracellular solute-binding protein [Chloroflexi bacterium]|nr:extracellular solute-binding protein [Chloroflexota bacterium]